MSISDVKIVLGKKTVQVTFDDNHVTTFHATWLRHNCHCDICAGKTIGSYQVKITQIPDELFIDFVSFDKEEDKLILTIENEPFQGHLCILYADYLRRLCYCDECLERKTKGRNFVYPSTEKERKITVLDFADNKLDTDEFYFRWMKTMMEQGLCQVINFPIEDDEVIKIAEQLGPIQSSPYASDGRFGVITNLVKDGAENTFNTTNSLAFHMDYPYTETAGHMALHNCIRFDPQIVGGESIVVNAFEAAEILRVKDPDAFKVLTKVPVLIENKAHPIWFQRNDIVSVLITTTSAIELQEINSAREIVNACIANTFPLKTQVRAKDVDKFFVAYKRWMEILLRPELEVQFRHKPNAVVCFDNRRFVHTRKAFQSNGGLRHFKELYISTEWMRGNYMNLAKKLGKDVQVPKLANFSSF